jgi:hypothetical protein
MTAKEIWYVWDKKTIISGAKKLLFNDGVVLAVGESTPPLGDVFDDKDIFVSYTLGETRERVECDGCDGEHCVYSYPDNDSNGGLVLSTCGVCQGRGYIWKAEVAL